METPPKEENPASSPENPADANKKSNNLVEAIASIVVLVMLAFAVFGLKCAVWHVFGWNKAEQRACTREHYDHSVTPKVVEPAKEVSDSKKSEESTKDTGPTLQSVREMIAKLEQGRLKVLSQLDALDLKSPEELESNEAAKMLFKELHLIESLLEDSKLQEKIISERAVRESFSSRLEQWEKAAQGVASVQMDDGHDVALGADEKAKKYFENQDEFRKTLSKSLMEKARLREEAAAKERQSQEEKHNAEIARCRAELAESKRVQSELQQRVQEQQRLEQERVANKSSEQLRFEQERTARERAEQQAKEHEHAAQECSAREASERQRAEQERFARERAEQNLQDKLKELESKWATIPSSSLPNPPAKSPDKQIWIYNPLSKPIHYQMVINGRTEEVDLPSLYKRAHAVQNGETASIKFWGFTPVLNQFILIGTQYDFQFNSGALTLKPVPRRVAGDSTVYLCQRTKTVWSWDVQALKNMNFKAVLYYDNGKYFQQIDRTLYCYEKSSTWGLSPKQVSGRLADRI